MGLLKSKLTMVEKVNVWINNVKIVTLWSSISTMVAKVTAFNMSGECYNMDWQYDENVTAWNNKMKNVTTWNNKKENVTA